jgi:DNA-binding transcriptional ArsR family regulator
MTSKNFLLLSLEDKETKKIANVVSNESCKKILDFLAEKDSTETEIAEILGIPLSTVHYNLKQLSDVGLVHSDEFHYSDKGKEVKHYKIANKYIIITPKKTEKLSDILKKLIPSFIVTFLATFMLFFYSLYQKTTQKASGLIARSNIVTKSAVDIAYDSEPEMMIMADNLIEPEVAVYTQPFIEETQNRFLMFFLNIFNEPLIWLWFLLGSLFTIAVIILFSWLRIRRNNKKRRIRKI